MLEFREGLQAALVSLAMRDGHILFLAEKYDTH